MALAASPVVPGTGVKLTNVGDDFEDLNWTFHPNFPKSSDEQDEQRRQPAGWSQNRRWYEGIKRGCPDLVQRVPTPTGGLEGSEGALLMRTIRSGIPGRPSYTMQQDDFICNVWQRLGNKIPVRQSPSCVVRVFMPPIKKWENRTGAGDTCMGRSRTQKEEENIFRTPTQERIHHGNVLAWDVRRAS